MKVINGGKGKEPPPTPEERARILELQIQAEFLKNYKALDPEGETLVSKKFDREWIVKDLGEGMRMLTLKFKRKGGPYGREEE